MVSHIRRTINPPYQARDLISIFLALFILLSIPITIIQVYSQNSSQASAQDNTTRNTSDTELPTVSFSSPKNSAYVAGYNYKIVINSEDNTAIKKVYLEIDGVKTAALTSKPYVYNWNLTNTKPGNHTLRATASDLGGNQQSSSIEVYRGVKQLSGLESN